MTGNQKLILALKSIKLKNVVDASFCVLSACMMGLLFCESISGSEESTHELANGCVGKKEEKQSSHYNLWTLNNVRNGERQKAVVRIMNASRVNIMIEAINRLLEFD